MSKTTIQIEKSTRKELSNLGKHSESYDEILNRLMAQYKVQKKGSSV